MNPTISDSEWKVIEILWKHPNSTVNEVVKCLEKTGWSYSTIKTMLNRLVEKGFAEVDKTVTNSYKYKAIMEEGEHKAKEARKFLQRVFDGSVSMFVSALAKGNKLSREEEEELKRIIDKMEDG